MAVEPHETGNLLRSDRNGFIVASVEEVKDLARAGTDEASKTDAGVAATKELLDMMSPAFSGMKRMWGLFRGDKGNRTERQSLETQRDTLDSSERQVGILQKLHRWFTRPRRAEDEARESGSGGGSGGGMFGGLLGMFKNRLLSALGLGAAAGAGGGILAMLRRRIMSMLGIGGAAGGAGGLFGRLRGAFAGISGRIGGLFRGGIFGRMRGAAGGLLERAGGFVRRGAAGVLGGGVLSRIGGSIKETLSGIFRGGAGGGILGRIRGAAGGIAGRVGGLFGGAGAGGLLRGMGAVSKGLLKRIPIVGSLLGLGMSFLGGEEGKTPEEKRKNKFKSYGGGIGGVIGAVLGSFGGPVGTVVGGIVGDMLGQWLGGWVSGVKWEDIAGTVVKIVSDGWDTFVKKAGSAWDTVCSSVANFLKGLVAPKETIPEITVDPKTGERNIRPKESAKPSLWGFAQDTFRRVTGIGTDTTATEAVTPEQRIGAGSSAAQMSADGTVEGFRKMIRKGESGGDYNIVNFKDGLKANGKQKWGSKRIDLQNMTIGQVKAMQREGKIFAAGANQMIGPTLAQTQKKMGLSDDTKFDKQTQDAMFLQLLKDAGLDSYRAGKISRTEFGKRVAGTWSSLPVLEQTKNNKGIIRKRGESYYSNSTDRANHSPEEFEKHLDALKRGGSTVAANPAATTATTANTAANTVANNTVTNKATTAEATASHGEATAKNAQTTVATTLPGSLPVSRANIPPLAASTLPAFNKPTIAAIPPAVAQPVINTAATRLPTATTAPVPMVTTVNQPKLSAVMDMPKLSTADIFPLSTAAKAHGLPPSPASQQPISRRVSNERLAWTAAGGIGMNGFPW